MLVLLILLNVNMWHLLLVSTYNSREFLREEVVSTRLVCSNTLRCSNLLYFMQQQHIFIYLFILIPVVAGICRSSWVVVTSFSVKMVLLTLHV